MQTGVDPMQGVAQRKTREVVDIGLDPDSETHLFDGCVILAVAAAFSIHSLPR